MGTLIGLHGFRMEVMATGSTSYVAGADRIVVFRGSYASWFDGEVDGYSDPLNSVGFWTGVFITNIVGSGTSGDLPGDFTPPPTIVIGNVTYYLGQNVEELSSSPRNPVPPHGSPNDYSNPPAGWVRKRIGDSMPSNWSHGTSAWFNGLATVSTVRVKTLRYDWTVAWLYSSAQP